MPVIGIRAKIGHSVMCRALTQVASNEVIAMLSTMRRMPWLAANYREAASVQLVGGGLRREVQRPGDHGPLPCARHGQEIRALPGLTLRPTCVYRKL
ncbi:hypothetical protein [Bradyrhizobium japonicum]|uniref:hypothetical protein n=1 Tax=Bradyrhizobium japonicum TaxID=375 RepID=UPI001BA930EF|nr:hypothetical protein [Bradyrhizobium japonicum]MBR0914900.1 hypothetical protein [Bradyrhizobium japonicum]